MLHKELKYYSERRK